MEKQTRYARASRRAFLKGGVAFGAAAALAACGDSDRDVFSSSDDSATVDQPTSTQAASDTPTTAAETTSTTSAQPAETTTTTTTTVATDPTAPIAIAFTYTMASGGKQLNPYVAIWVEDADGALLRTVGLWYQQDRKGRNWLDDVKSWWRTHENHLAGGGADVSEAISSATRAPGSYSLLWDGTDDNGIAVEQTDVVICIESARERGPTSFVCQPVDRRTFAGPLAMAADGELSNATLDVV